MHTQNRVLKLWLQPWKQNNHKKHNLEILLEFNILTIIEYYLNWHKEQYITINKHKSFHLKTVKHTTICRTCAQASINRSAFIAMGWRWDTSQLSFKEDCKEGDLRGHPFRLSTAAELANIDVNMCQADTLDWFLRQIITHCQLQLHNVLRQERIKQLAY